MTLVFFNYRVEHFGQERAIDAEQFSVTSSAAQQTAQYIAATFIGRNNTITDHHSSRTNVVSDNAKRDIYFFVLVILYTCNAFDVLHNIAHGIDFKQRTNALYHTSQTFQTHTGINIFLLEFGIVAVTVIVELGEYVVPYFHIAVTIAADRTIGLVAAIFFATVVINFRAWAARAGAMFPEVIALTETENALGRNTNFLVPDFKRLVVIDINGRIQAARVNAHPFRRGQELPAPMNGFTFEVVTKREVTEHFKISAMTGSFADIFNVASTNALLAGGDATARGFLFAGEEWLHGSHTGVDEKQRSVILRNQRKAGQTQMTFALKERKIHFAKLI